MFKAIFLSLLQPLSVPDQAWQVASLNFIEGLPRSGKANCILVVDLWSIPSANMPTSTPS
jgi:hypothetical protein